MDVGFGGGDTWADEEQAARQAAKTLVGGGDGPASVWAQMTVSGLDPQHAAFSWLGPLGKTARGMEEPAGTTQERQPCT